MGDGQPSIPVGIEGPEEMSRAGTEDDSFPLNSLQTAYLVGRDPQFPLGGVATFFYYEFDRRSDDQEADLRELETAWNRLVEHHPMLRMVIGSDLRQRILPEVPRYRFACTDLRGVTSGTIDQTLVDLRAECSHQARAGDTWPLFDIRAAFLPDGRIRLYVGFDVLAVCLASWLQLMREWGALVDDPAFQLSTPSATFADFARRRENSQVEIQRRARDREYWAARAPHLPDGPALPWCSTPDELGVPHFTRHPAELNAAEWSGLRARAAQYGLSPTGVLFAAYGLVLARWGAADPFSLNTTLFDQHDVVADDASGLHDVVGAFTTSILVEMPEVNLATWSGFADYAGGVNRRFWTDMEHRSVSSVEALREHRGPDLTPTHPVVFTSGVGLGAGETPAAWLGTEVFGVSQTPQVLIDHITWDHANGLRICWDIVDGSLPQDYVDGMVAAHVRLLRRLATDDDAWTDPALGWDPSFRPDEPLGVAPYADAGPLLSDPLCAAAKRDPESPALLGAGGRMTHGELARRAAHNAAAFAGLGIGPGDLVAVATEKDPTQIVAVLGVSASGAAYVPVEPSWPSARVASICAQAGIRHAVISAGTKLQWPDDVTVYQLDEEGLVDVDVEAEPMRPRPDELAYTIFTSGSTGRPKGVAVEHRQARTTLDDMADRFALGLDDRVLALSAFSFDLSVYDIFGLLGAGGALVLPEGVRQRDPGHWLDLMAEHRVTVWNTAPALLEMLVEYAEMDPDSARAALGSLRTVLLSGDWIPVTLPDRIRALAPHTEVISLGGATEGAIWSICFPIGEVDPGWTSIPYGRALRAQSFHILDSEQRPCPVGEPGELFIGGGGVAREYVGDPVQTEQRFSYHDILRRRLYRTGDLGCWRADGNIEFLGRVDRQVKIRGHRIELGEVESVLARAPGVRKAVAMSTSETDTWPQLITFVVPADPAAAPSEEDLVALLRSSLPEYMMPRRFMWLDDIPVTSNGKIDYAALRNSYDRETPASTAEAESVPTVGAENTWLDEIAKEAAAEGLGVSLTITPGSLALGDALSAAGRLSGRLRDLAGARSASLTERLATNGLLEIVIENPSSPDTGPIEPTNGGAPAVDQPAKPATKRDPELERAISAVMADLVDTPVNETTPFFQLGANSLILVLAHRRLAAELDPELAVVDLFARPTVRDLALLISQRRAKRVVVDPPAVPAAVEPSTAPIARARTSRRAARRAAAEVVE
jgi:amino acid adenylation domain-containing protein